MTDKIKFTDLSAEEQTLETNIRGNLSRARAELDQVQQLIGPEHFKEVLKMFNTWLIGHAPEPEPSDPIKVNTVVEIFENLDRIKETDPTMLTACINMIKRRYDY